MSQKLVAMYVRSRVALASRMVDGTDGEKDRGQGALEYIGAIIVASLVVAALVAGFTGVDIKGKVTGAVNSILNAKF